MKEDGVARACSLFGNDVKCIQNWVHKPEIEHLEDIYIERLTILKWIINKSGEDWIHLTYDRDQWQAPVITRLVQFSVTSSCVHGAVWKVGCSLADQTLLVSQEWLWPHVLVK